MGKKEINQKEAEVCENLNAGFLKLPSDHTAPLVSIITVGMNHLELLKKYLDSLFVIHKPSVSFELIYVDNCSTDGSVEFVLETYTEVKVIQNTQIKGFAENNNIGVINSSAKYVFILNPDVILLPNSVDNLYKYFIKNQSIGILVPKLLNPDKSVQFSVRKFLNLKIVFKRFIDNGKDDLKSKIIRDYLLIDFDPNKIQFVNWALGAAMLFDRNWYDKLGGFDEGYFLYVEDTDICLRSWKLGKPVVYFPESKFIHEHQRSSSVNWRKKKLHIKSMIRFFFKHNVFFQSYNYAD